ncbi:uncharacterized protein F4812DRAFT_433718 [Daldinia caldariorum]|uniref:uncharacterized protein n=1 Tax=Daldinia caldariorum TaxID=326644 RepID=UPI002008B813|nr:uncharacterized protein F4812DRAFT_433718 [Daldinia caldariorum]KAI1466327.1 hypothetical protein F4812DRAFT_433718 [Daldinia caldariorum]
MASSPSQPPQPTASAPPQPQPQSPPGANPFVHNVALGVTPIALLALFLPPRRLDLRAAILGGVALWGTNQLVADYSGTSSMQRMARRIGSLSGAELPEKAKETQARLRAERARRAAATAAAAQEGLLMEDQRRRRMAEEEEERNRRKERGLLEKVWMGDSDEDWKAKRDQREKEALSEGGGGYWGLIVDQVSEVWSQGVKKKDEEGKEDKEGQSKKP